MDHNFLIHSSADGHLGCFHVLTIVNSATMNFGVHASVLILISSEYMPKNEIAGLYDIFISSFERNLHTLLHSGCISLHQCKRVPFLPHPRHHLLFRIFDDDHSDPCEMMPHCDFDLHSLIMSDVEHLFLCLLAICMSSFGEGNGTPLQYSCLENPMDGGAW